MIVLDLKNHLEGLCYEGLAHAKINVDVYSRLKAADDVEIEWELVLVEDVGRVTLEVQQVVEQSCQLCGEYNQPNQTTLDAIAESYREESSLPEYERAERVWNDCIHDDEPFPEYDPGLIQKMIEEKAELEKKVVSQAVEIESLNRFVKSLVSELRAPRNLGGCAGPG